MDHVYAKGVSGQQFKWRAPAPLDPTGVVSATWDGGVQPLAVVQSAIVIDTDATDGRKVTASTPSELDDFAGMVGTPWGEAFVLSNEGGYHPVVVHHIEGATIWLADPWTTTPQAVSATLQWRWYVGTISDARVASVARGIPWTVEYPEVIGAVDGVLTSTYRKAHGLAHVVHKPFATGVTDADVLAILPQSTATPHRRQQNYGPQIKMAHTRLVIRLRNLLASRQLDEHDLHAPEELRLAHATLAAAAVLDQQAPEAAERFRAEVLGEKNPNSGRRVGGMLSELVTSIALDKDRDGEVDDGEKTAALSGTPLGYPSVFRDRQDVAATKRKFNLTDGW